MGNQQCHACILSNNAKAHAYNRSPQSCIDYWVTLLLSMTTFLIGYLETILMTGNTCSATQKKINTFDYITEVQVCNNLQAHV